jgi:hypothetical protein
MFRNWKRIREENQAKWFGAIFGIFIFFGSILLLWNNEGRVNFGKLAEESILINATVVSSSVEEGQLVALNGNLTSIETLGDPFFLPESDYIKIERDVEMYAWEETKEEDENDSENVNYFYNAEWTTSPNDSSQFYDTSYENPYLPFDSETFTVGTANVENFQINPNTIGFPGANTLDLSQIEPFNNSPDQSPMTKINNFLYLGYTSISQPEIGDLRISFNIVPQKNDVSAFGQIENDRLLPVATDREDFYRILFMDRESSIDYLKEEYKSQLWGSRIGGMFLMWCGLFLLLNPMTILVSFIPIINKGSKWLVLIIALVVSAILSVVTITISFFAHNPFILLILLAIIVGLFYEINKLADKQQVN